MRVAKQAAEDVAAAGSLELDARCSAVAPVVVVAEAHVVTDGHQVLGCDRRGPFTGTVPLAHQVADAQHCRVEGQVASAGFGRPPRAQGISPQGDAELGSESIKSGVQMRRECHKVSRALLDPALILLLAMPCIGKRRNEKQQEGKGCGRALSPRVVKAWFPHARPFRLQ